MCECGFEGFLYGFVVLSGCLVLLFFLVGWSWGG